MHELLIIILFAWTVKHKNPLNFRKSSLSQDRVVVRVHIVNAKCHKKVIYLKKNHYTI